MSADRPSPRSDSVAEPVVRPRWGIGDFVWIYVAGIGASLVAATIGFAISHDTSDHIGALTTGLSLFGQFGAWFACLLAVAASKGRSARRDFGFTVHARDWWVPLVGIGTLVVVSAIIRPLVSLSDAKQEVVDDLNKSGGAKLTILVLVAVLVAPVCEELLFRGLLLRALRRRYSPEVAVVGQALVFAFAHVMLSPTLGDLAVVPGLFLMGAISGVLATRRGDLSASILFHIGFNLLTALFAL